jgi:hypothetical protein
VRQRLAGARVYDLLDSSLLLALGQRPGRLGEELGPKDELVVIDEIQRLPELLNEVQRLIEERGVRFVLTGSSTRKLRRGGVNLLGGRARTRRLHPLSARELGARFDLGRAVERGLMPSIYFSDDPEADLAAYAGTYLQQEIVAEGATRNVPAFSRFLRVAALCNGTVKAKANVADRELRSLRALGEEKGMKRLLCVSLEPRRRRVGGVAILPWREFLAELWAGAYRS